MNAVCILGSTGSIGLQALDILAEFPDRFRVTTLTADTQVTLLAEQARRHQARTAVIMREELLPALRAALDGTPTRAACGATALLDAVTDPDTDTVLSAIVGFAGLRPLLAAAAAGKRIALANKEPIVAAGGLVMRAISDGGATLLPVDSEPSAIMQCLLGQDRGGLARVILTASGGALKELPLDALARVTPEQALRHPTWRMGRKITVDSATLMNKGLELIEARWLFDLAEERIGIVIHPQSIVHSLVEFRDGSLLAQLGVPSMRTPIQYALGFPARLPRNWAPLDLVQAGTLTFAPPDFTRFPAPALARQAIVADGTMPTCLNAANEVAVAAFLAYRIGFLDIARYVERAMAAHDVLPDPSLDEILGVDTATRAQVERWMPTA